MSAATFVQAQTANHNSPTLSVTFAGTTAHNCLIVAFGNSAGTDLTPTVSDGTNTYTLVSITRYSNGSKLRKYLATNIAGGAVTITVSGYSGTGGPQGPAQILIAAEYQPCANCVWYGAYAKTDNMGVNQAFAAQNSLLGTANLTFSSQHPGESSYNTKLAAIDPANNVVTIIASEYGDQFDDDTWTTNGNLRASAFDVPSGHASQGLADKDFSLATTTQLHITSGSPPAGTVGMAYSFTFTAAGGTAPYTWSVISGSLPPGLSLNASTGVLSGTPTMAGGYGFVIKVTDSAAIQACAAVYTIIAIGPQNVKTYLDTAAQSNFAA